MKMTWNESMSTGVIEIDSQHQALIQQLNRLDDAVGRLDREIRPDEVLDLLEYLETFAVRHFADEERQMEVFQCGAAEENAEDHQQFLAIVRRLQRTLQRDPARRDREALRGLRDELFTWCQTHWRTVDSKLRDAVLHCRTCPTP